MDAYILSLVAQSKLAKRDDIETFDESSTRVNRSKVKQGGSIAFFVVMLAMSCYAAYLSWTRNGSELVGMKTGPRRIIYAIVAFIYGLSYLTSYAVFLRNTGIR
jgi:hypothetical protein